MLGRAFGAVGWSLLFGFLGGCAAYAVASFLTARFGPVFYSYTLINHIGMGLIYGIAGAIVLGGAFLASYVLWLRSKPARAAIARLAVVAFVVQCCELGIVEALGIRNSNALGQPITDQLMPFNFGLFAPVGIWEGRPDAAFFWFSAAVVAFVYAAIASRRA